MEFVDDAAEAGAFEVGIDLGGGDVGVTEQGLDGAEIRAAFEQVSGEGVAEHVGVEGAVVTGGELQTAQGFPIGTRIETGAASANKQEGRRFAGEEGGAGFGEVAVQRGGGLGADGDDALAIAFTEDGEAQGEGLVISEADADEFTDAKAGAVGELKHGPVAEAGGGSQIEGGGKLGEAGRGNGLGQGAGGLGSFEEGGGVVGNAAFRGEKTEQTAEAAGEAGEAAGTLALGGAVGLEALKSGNFRKGGLRRLGKPGREGRKVPGISLQCRR